MKKKTYSITSEPTKIWRDNIDLSEIVNEVDLKNKDFKNLDESQIFERINNDKNKYINDELYDKKILEEFPEYLAGWKTVITNTGLIAFYKIDKISSSLVIESDNLVIYDLFEHDDTDLYPVDSLLKFIEPDISMLLDYNMFDQPLNVRRLNIRDHSFIPENKYFYNGYEYVFINCDEIKGFSYSNNCGKFKRNTRTTSLRPITSISFNYKPIFIFRLKDSSGNEYDLNRPFTLKVNGKTVTAKKYVNRCGVYFIDLSEEKTEHKLSISANIFKDGFIEVI